VRAIGRGVQQYAILGAVDSFALRRSELPPDLQAFEIDHPKRKPWSASACGNSWRACRKVCTSWRPTSRGRRCARHWRRARWTSLASASSAAPIDEDEQDNQIE
jgi:hypothetical protein